MQKKCFQLVIDDVVIFQSARQHSNRNYVVEQEFTNFIASMLNLKFCVHWRIAKSERLAPGISFRNLDLISCTCLHTRASGICEKQTCYVCLACSLLGYSGSAAREPLVEKACFILTIYFFTVEKRRSKHLVTVPEGEILETSQQSAPQTEV